MAIASSVSVVAANGPDSLIYWRWVDRHIDDILAAVRTHLYLTGIAVGVGLLIAIPLAVASRRHRRARSTVLIGIGILYTIPSIALFFLLGPWTGYTALATAEIALISYTLLILVRNTLEGLDAVPPEVREAARGMGYSSLRLLTGVEIPLALPSILAGVRIATVSTIGLVTVAAIIGQGGLGQLILNDGLQRDFKTPVVVGAVLSVALALVADVILLTVQRLLTPWARTRGRRAA
ncbi:MAG: ABC transporter permease [Frankiaceae bacterium]